METIAWLSFSQPVPAMQRNMARVQANNRSSIWWARSIVLWTACPEKIGW
jgi:hypothetical protein